MEYILACNHFYQGQYAAAMQTVESVRDFDSNPSFLFIWGYNYYLVCQKLFIVMYDLVQSVQQQKLSSYYDSIDSSITEPPPQLCSSDVVLVRSRLEAYALSHKESRNCFLSYLMGLCMRVEKNNRQALEYFVEAVQE